MAIDDELLNKLYEPNKQEYQQILNPNPVTVLPVVTQEDARNGFLLRYFIRLANDTSYAIEIDKNQYEKFKNNPRFLTVKLKWKIVGNKKTYTLSTGANLYGVEDQNRITVADADLTFKGLTYYIKDYLEYWIAER